MLVLVCRSHPEPTQTFHRRTAAAMAAEGVAVERWALRRARGAVAASSDDGTRFLRDARPCRTRALLRHPLRSLGALVGLVARARRRDKEGGRLGALAAWADGLALADHVRRRGDVTRLHAQFASWEASAAAVASRLTGVPFSFEVHNPYTWVAAPGALAAKVRAADVVTAISQEARRRVAALVPAAAAKVRVVRCGVDVEHPPRPSPATPRFDVVAVGSLVPRKGHEVLVKAAARLAARRPGVRVAVVGDGPLRASLEALARALDAPVTFLGARPEDEAGAITAAATVACLACVVAADGDEDGVPVALLEAMAAGVPVVSTPVGGIAELLEDGRAGVLVAPHDAVGLASALDRLLGDAALRARLAAAGREAVVARHDLSACARDLAAALGA